MAADAQPLSVAVVGAGAVGGYYGGRLAEAGHDVRFLLRRDYEAVRAHGLHVASPDGDFVLERPKIARTPEELGQVDWVLCALKATAMPEMSALVTPCLGPQTRILALMNGLGLEEQFAEHFGAARVFGGLAFTCINRGAPGYIHHLDFGPIVVGHLLNDPAELEIARALWLGSHVKVSVTLSLLHTRWEKLGWNIPFNGLTVAVGGAPTDRIVGDPALRAAVHAIMVEVLTTGDADLQAHGETVHLDHAAIIERYFIQTDAMGAYRPSTMIDFVEGRSMEVEAIFAEPLRRARVLGVEVPRLELLTAVLRALNHGRVDGE